ncbi:hypothetical protein KP509_12G042800 [Ceratopteris richardii]|uniref:Uncharacterized protein n=1 Tax=Ceratopteris richardii TaxID=49495 RepID=A0A8T2TIL5_CERRI|nr:hypothetical protein KP509_12G042800 [Ceratopteris richardii]
MAQCCHSTVVYRCSQQYFAFSYSTSQACKRSVLRSYLSEGDSQSIAPKSTRAFRGTSIALPARLRSIPSISCFRDDDPFLTEHFFNRDRYARTIGKKLEITYSPWAMSMMNGYRIPFRIPIKESTGGPTGGGRGNGDGDGDGGGGGDDEGEEEQLWLLPSLTIAFAVLHLGYCLAIWKDEDSDLDFIWTGMGLFCLLILSAVRLNNQTGIDAYFLGLGASIGVMLWTGERCLLRKECSTAGLVSFFGAAMATLFSLSLHNIIIRCL